VDPGTPRKPAKIAAATVIQMAPLRYPGLATMVQRCPTLRFAFCRPLLGLDAHLLPGVFPQLTLRAAKRDAFALYKG